MSTWGLHKQLIIWGMFSRRQDTDPSRYMEWLDKHLFLKGWVAAFWSGWSEGSGTWRDLLSTSIYLLTSEMPLILFECWWSWDTWCWADCLAVLSSVSPVYHLRCYSRCVPKFLVTDSASTVPVSVQVLISVAKTCPRNTHTDKMVDNIPNPTSPFPSLIPIPTSSQALCLPWIPAPVWLDSSKLILHTSVVLC